MKAYNEVTKTIHPVGGLRFSMEFENGHSNIMNARHIIAAMGIPQMDIEFDSGMCHTSVKILEGEYAGKWFDVHSDQIGNDLCVITLLEDK